MNAIELLKQDHEVVKQLLEKLVATTERGVKTRRDLVQKLHMELAVHTDLEEQIFYPAYQQAGARDEAVMTAEATEEHRAVDSQVLPDLIKTDPSTTTFAGRAKVLKELLEHHIEEEEKEMFPKATKLLGAKKLKELGLLMEERKRSLKQALSREAA
ncbi:hemerythrin domain-containing protein [Pseudomonas sp. PDM16]|uniref:hemerythrin domain-containing protein n=1 Tax=Pseudomonas sp. PDM16 TaxID=2769292 RepID=UPI001782B54F|nr:hemerythrin domain-containing protein [Pseudomonas sp. PDM16]MBD9416179.1 hemerythrin domain-containing protein [Pseudomonas sp. PDM16]